MGVGAALHIKALRTALDQVGVERLFALVDLDPRLASRQ